MRELKFRAWIKRAQQMASWEEIQEKQNLSRLIGNPEYPLMQFTGLKDRNGIDIYEGDLLECIHDCDDGDFATIAKVQFGDYMSWEIHHISGHNWGSDSREGLAEWGDCADDYLKVVGNIYENPELEKDDIGFEEEDIAAANAWANSLQDDI